MSPPWTRRDILRTLAGVGVSGAVAPLLGGAVAHAGMSSLARRVVFFYMPDGVPGASASGEPSAFHAWESHGVPQLPVGLTPLTPWVDRCLFFRNLSMGPTGAGSHPDGAKKLLTARDHGMGESIDHFLGRTAGAAAPWRHLVLGAAATVNSPSSDKYIVYPSAGQSLAPEDSPRRAFSSLFGGGFGTRRDPTRADRSTASILDAHLQDLADLRSRLGTAERSRLDLHQEALRELELRLDVDVGTLSCDTPKAASTWPTDESIHAPEQFGAVLTAQIDVAVAAMACGLTNVVTLQASHHTSEQILSRIPGSPMYDPAFDMRSHQASHYGPSHDLGNRLYADFLSQRQWFLERYAYLLQSLHDRPEGDGTMLDYSLVVLVTEVSDGNTHAHDDMPFILAGGGGGRVRTGHVIDQGYRRHGDLWAAVGQAMGQDLQGWGDGSFEALPGVLTR